MTTPSQALAEFCAALQFDAVPGEVVEHAKLCILDGLGCALYGADLDCGRIIGGYVRDLGGRAEASLWGMPGRVPAAAAALVNGTLVHSFELDDLHKTSILHPTSVALPAALAAAEAGKRATGASLVTAYVAGAEAGIRAGNTVGTVQLADGFHPTGTLGPIAAAAAAGNQMGLEAAAMLHALSIGATQAAGLMSAQYESMVKRVHAGRAAQSGVMAAELAQRGLTGIDAVFEAEYGGFCTTFGGPEADVAALTDGLGERFECLKTGFKSYSACGSTHTTIDAMKTLRAEHGLGPGDIERIEVEATTATFHHVGFAYVPGSSTSAQMNLPYAAAVTLMDGEAFVDQYTEAKRHDPAVIALTRRIGVAVADDLDAAGRDGRHSIRANVITKDGRQIRIARQHAKGSPAEPLTRAEVIAKFHRLAAARIGADGAERLYDCVMSLEKQPSLELLLALIAPCEA